MNNIDHLRARRKAFAKRESIMRRAINDAIQALIAGDSDKAGRILVDAREAEKAVIVPHRQEPTATDTQS